MDSETVVSITREMLSTSVTIVLPVLAVGLLVGLFFAIVQAITSVQEQTLGMIPKMLAVALTLMVLAPWMLQKLMDFARNIFAMVGNGGGPTL